nr:agamous-like MADS-box protein AGL61 [Ipomoea batatas]
MGMYSLATGLSTFNNRSAIKVRVIRSYVVREKKGSAQIKSQELVLHDPESDQPLKQITELAGKTLLFQITAKSDHTSYRNTPFPVLRINNDPLIIKEHCSQLLNLEENACNSNMQISLGDDDFLEVSVKLEDWSKTIWNTEKIASKELAFLNFSQNTSRGVTRGRQRVPLARIENEVQRLVTFSKRRTGLFKKASEMSTLCGTEIAMVVFSPSGKPFSFSNPDMNTVLTKYFGEIPNIEANVHEHIIRAQRNAKMRAMTSQINVLEAQIDEEMLVSQALREAEKGRPSISDLQLPELQLMKQQMETLLYQVTEKLNMFSMMGAQSQAREARFGGNYGAGPSGV